jgi:glycosyltransferase involved in cell wall biosynthesis
VKIASLCNDFSASGGVGNYMKRLHKAWAAAGHESYVIHSDAEAKETDKRVFFVEHFDLFPWEGRAAAATKKVMEILSHIQPDIVHVQNNNNTQLESAVRKSFPAVKSMHTYEFCPAGNKFHYFGQKTCQVPTSALCIPRMIYMRCTLSKSPMTMVRLYREAKEVNRHGAEHTKIIVPSDFARLKTLENDYTPEQVETALYFTDYPASIEPALYDQNLILFTGRIVPEKGLNKLILAADLLKRSMPWEVVVAGDGPGLEEAKHLVKQVGLESRFKFLGWRPLDQIIELYKRATMVVMPSLWPEPFGAVGIEAMSYGKPVIAFAVGGIPEWLEHNRTGYLIEPFDLPKMAEAMEHLLLHPRKAKEMGLNGRNSVRQKFSPENHVSRLLEIYRKVL